MSVVGQDLRYAVRMLLNKPGFTAVALIVLADGPRAWTPWLLCATSNRV